MGCVIVVVIVVLATLDGTVCTGAVAAAAAAVLPVLTEVPAVAGAGVVTPLAGDDPTTTLRGCAGERGDEPATASATKAAATTTPTRAEAMIRTPRLPTG